MKLRKSYIVINGVLLLACIIFMGSIFVFYEQKVLIGVLFRLALSLLVIINAIYLTFSNELTVMSYRMEEKYRRLVGILLLVVGFFGFVTALMGYGINGYPLLDWKSIF